MLVRAHVGRALATVWRQRHPNAVPAAFAGVTAGLLAALIAVAHAAPSATATKKDEPFHANVPAALLLDPDSESILYEKNGEELVAPASLAKLMTLEYVFNEIKQGRLKLDEEVIISENAWRKGGAPSRGSTMYAAIHSRVKVDDLIHGIMQLGLADPMPASRSPKYACAGDENSLRRNAYQAGAGARAGKIDLHQLDRLFGP